MTQKLEKMVLAIILALVISSQAVCAFAQGGGDDPAARDSYQAFFDQVDTDYAYEIAYELSTNPALRSSSLGSRTAGSDAEHAAADYLVRQMEELGLSDVEKVAVDVTKWQFNDATLTLPDGTEIKPHSYATAATDAQGITAEIIYLGEGTMYDYEGVDAAGKIVLIDIDMRANWWVTYPMLEAQFQGAAAIISANVSGFSEISPDALNSQDICAPTGIPCVSISLNDSNRIKALLDEGEVVATLVVDNVVEDGGTSYNVIGRIPGKSSDEIILVGGHYDMYFYGFQDDNCAVALVLAMAKAMLESGYTPERDIVFCMHGAEEWGATGTQFDWTVGAWRMIYEAHPEWAGKILAFINFELPAYEFADYTYVTSAPELYTLIEKFVRDNPNSPDPEDCFPEGVKTDGYPTYTYSDDFSYYVAGVPGTVNGFLMTAEQDDVFPFYYERYHSQFDDPDTYDADVLAFNTKFYGALAMYIDQTPAYLLDFGAQYDRLMDAFDESLFALSGVDSDAYLAAAQAVKAAAESAYAAGEDINARYEEARLSGDADAMAAIFAEGIDYNETILAAFKLAQDELLGLMYERPIVPHYAYQENISLMQSIIECLEQGDVATAADEYAWSVNNVLEWYNFFFSPEVTARANDMFYGEYNKDNLFWGTNRMFTSANVEEATRSLYARYDEEGGDFAAEIAVYQASIDEQKVLLAKFAAEEIEGANALAALLGSVGQ